MQRIISFLLLLSFSQIAGAQKRDAYTDSALAFRKNYMATHEVVRKKDRKYFRFFPPDEMYRVSCRFERLSDSTGLVMKTSANTLQYYTRYGVLHFSLSGKPCRLFIYQRPELMKNEKLKEYLFLPFTDSTSGDESYGSGRYLDLSIGDIRGDAMQLDFNKAYNPYCAYATGFHCPVPPRENNLSVAVRAGEMVFGKKH